MKISILNNDLPYLVENSIIGLFIRLRSRLNVRLFVLREAGMNLLLKQLQRKDQFYK